MAQSNSQNILAGKSTPGICRPEGLLHTAIIPDGNGRWARARGLPREAGHRAGVEAVRRVVGAAPDLGIDTLTFFAFSSANWERPQGEVLGILHALEQYLRADAPQWVETGVRVRILGRRDRLPRSLRAAAEAAERATARGAALEVRLALDYSAREAILRSACRLYTALEISPDAFARLLNGWGGGFGSGCGGGPEASADARLAPGPTRDVDLLIRTGGEQRLSDFLLWESAYAELVFTERMWPDFDAADLEAAVAEFHRRERRFGRVPDAAAG
jgi:undecaprenyl diphosphate synthase